MDEAKAEELRKKGTCPCEDGGGSATTDTIPATGDDSTFDVFANHHAVGAWGYASLVVEAFDAKGNPISSKTIKPGTKGSGFAAFKTEIKAFVSQAKKSGGVTFKFVTGKPRI